ncbi:MAG: hypothetical protein IJS68_02410 [Clostridia bacterium]|nr:hypothetical protein [Clostridia bacterium]
MAEERKTRTQAGARKPATKAQAPKKPVAKKEVEPAKQETIVREQPKQNKERAVLTGANGALGLNIAGVAIGVISLLAFTAVMLVMIVSNSPATINVILQVLAIVLVGLVAWLCYCQLKRNFDVQKANLYIASELICELIVAILAIVGFGSYFALLAMVPMVVISAVKLWIMQSLIKK